MEDKIEETSIVYNTSSLNSGSNCTGGWKLEDTLGNNNSQNKFNNEGDTVTCIEYDSTGTYLASGNKGGKIIIYTQNDNLYKHSSVRDSLIKKNGYSTYIEFQSHTAEFDYLKSLEIEEKINKIKWSKKYSDSLFLFSTNDKTIKLWKIYEKSFYQVAGYNSKDSDTVSALISPRVTPINQTYEIMDDKYPEYVILEDGTQDNVSPIIKTYNHNNRKYPTSSDLIIPKLSVDHSKTEVKTKRIYANAHTYHINSISLNSDGETLLSADDLRINLWNIDIPSNCHNIIDIKPNSMEELTEVITAAEFHPQECNVIVHSSSKGTIKLNDLRQNALCDRSFKIFEEQQDPDTKSFFSEIIASISDVKFTNDGKFIISRDYLSLKIWDIRIEHQPIQTIQVHDHLHSRLCELYDNDCIFDKFECSISSNNEKFSTGSYSNECYIYNRHGQDKSKLVPVFSSQGRRHSLPINSQPQVGSSVSGYENVDTSRKVLQTMWHPHSDEIVFAICNNLYIYRL